MLPSSTMSVGSQNGNSQREVLNVVSWKGFLLFLTAKRQEMRAHAVINGMRFISLVMRTETSHFVAILGDRHIAKPLLQLWAA